MRKYAPPPTYGECVELMQQNIAEAARREERLQREYDGLKIGDKRLGAVCEELNRAKVDQRHWRGYARFYREHLTAHPGDANRPVLEPGKNGRATLAILSVVGREPGSDDDEPAMEAR